MRVYSRACLAALLLIFAARPVVAAERSIVLLYGFTASSANTPPAIAVTIAVLARDELEKSGKFAVIVRNADDPQFRRVESEQPGVDPTLIHQALRVGRTLGARYVVQGVVTAYEPPRDKAPGKVTLRLIAGDTASDVSRELFVTAEMKVPGRGAAASAKVLGPAARAVATGIAAEAIPQLERATPADREQAAQRARERGKEAAAGGATREAVDDLRRAARLTPEDAATHGALGEAWVKQGMMATALLEFRQALALDVAGGAPTDAVRALRLRLVRALGERGLWDEAVAEAKRGLDQEPAAEPLRLALAEASLRSGDGAGALAALRSLHGSRAPEGVEWSLLAEAHALMGDAPHWLDAVVRGAVAGVPDAEQYGAVVRRLDLAFHALADDSEEAERRVLAGQLSVSDFGAAASRRGAQAKAAVDYLGRLAFPVNSEAAHMERQAAWAGLARAAERARQFADGGNYDDLASTRGERLRAVAQLEALRGK